MTGMGASSVTNSTATYVEAVGPDDVIWADNPQLGIGIFNQGKSVKTEYKHRLPVRVGLNVAYRLTDRLSVESGVSYTRLSSDMKDGTKDNYSSGSQKLDYIGVPLNVKYRALGYRRLSVYASAGLLTEKCVSGKTTHEYVISGEKKKHEAEIAHYKQMTQAARRRSTRRRTWLRSLGSCPSTQPSELSSTCSAMWASTSSRA